MEKRKNQVGRYILRESEFSYNTYYVDICKKNGYCMPITFIKKLGTLRWGYTKSFSHLNFFATKRHEEILNNVWS